MRTALSSDGVTLTIHELGGAGRPVLLCHATGFHGAVWGPLGAALGTDLAKWAVDFRAHGESPLPPGAPLAWSAFADDVLATVDALGLHDGDLVGVGHSMGGAALLLAEIERPGTFAGMWVYEPITPPSDLVPASEGGNLLAEGAARRRAAFASPAEALANFAAKAPLSALRADVLHAYVAHGFEAGEDGAVHLACRPEHESQIYRGGGTHHTFDRLGEVACPVVVACGRDEPGPVLWAPAVAAALPQGRLERHPGLGHFGPLEAPGTCALAVADLLASL